MRSLFDATNVDKSDPIGYPDGRIKNNDGTGNGTPVNESTKGDLHQMLQKLMRLYGIVPNGLPDNEINDFQLISALRGLASKNDFIYPLTTNGTILSINIKLSLMLDNEFIVCLAGANKGTETEIKGIGANTYVVNYSGDFKANEYVRVIKTAAGVSIIRVADWISLSAMATELGFLKKATQAQENTGAIDTVSTTPLSNLTAFVKRVIGTDSINYLATAARNGLYPKEHFVIVDGLTNSVKSKVVKLNSWSLNRQFTAFTGLASGNVIQGINCFLECTVANNGFAIGDVVTAPTPYPTDSGRTSEQGIGVQFKESVHDLFHVLVLDQITIAQAWTVDGSSANHFIIPNTTQWAIRFVILYS